MSYDIESIDDLVDALGGNTAIGDWLGITPEAVSNWKARAYIPPGWHLKLTAALIKRGKRINPRVFGLEDDDVPFLSAVA